MKQNKCLKCRGTRHRAQKERGITLIALVITIILLLILAGVTIKKVLDNNFVNKAQLAVDKYSEQQAKEKLNIAIMTYKILKYSGEEITLEETIKEIGGEIEYKESEEIYIIKIYGYEFELDKTLTIKEETKVPEKPTEPEKTKYTLTVEKGNGISNISPTTQEIEEGKSIELTATVETGYIFEKWEIVNGEATIANVTDVKTTITPTSDVTIKAIAKFDKIVSDEKIQTVTTKLLQKDYAYNNPPIPEGFRTLDTEESKWESTDGVQVAGWNDGLVITDSASGSNGNEFVWVPVDGTKVTYTKWLGGLYSKNITSVSQLSDDTLPSGVLEWGQTEQSQITKYGGFYIGRYGAGIPNTLTTAISTVSAVARDVTGNPVSKKNQVPWNFISYTKSKANAERMYTGSNVKSGLVTGTMWDTTLKWLKNSGVNVESNCTGWGNYVNSSVKGITQYSTNDGASWISVNSVTKPTGGTNKQDYLWLLKTGNTDYTKKKNIYDLAGNLYEWTSEKLDSKVIRRSGAYQYLSGRKSRRSK